MPKENNKYSGNSGTSRNKQEKLKDFAESVPGDNRNQNHDARQVSLGPNTKRRDK
ncbi:MAG: hypothetical protein FWG44_02620 [Oscillospiraceae bacterium]|nr:hypothetical protein [Oscillospiraceae bacterium]